MEGKEPDTLNKTLKAVGSAYDMAGRLGWKFKARAAGAAASSKSPARASAPPGATDAAVAVAAAAAADEPNRGRPKSPQSWGSSSPNGLQRSARGKKLTGDAPAPGVAVPAGSGNCVVS
ncbi:unnamed protein product [Ectocarpus sp. 13 AM-2016]